MEATTIVELDPSVIAGIAAGEVVERPASIVKELVENAIDAGSTEVVVEIEAGGRELIRVSDDGAGIPVRQIRQAVVRHATSKLRELEDLDRIGTLGFRGEGLWSICAVSEVSLTSRSSSDGTGTTLWVEGGTIQEQRPAGARVGTTVEVRNVFYNTPARRKFLKSDATECAHIEHWLTLAASAFPEIHFSLSVDGRCVLRLARASNLDVRAQQIFGRPSRSLCSVPWHGDPPVRARGAFCRPEVTASSTKSLIVTVNRRAVRDRLLQHCLIGAFQEALPHGRYPIGAFHLEIDPKQIDVNVHPQKMELRFADAARVCQVLGAVVATGLKEHAASDTGTMPMRASLVGASVKSYPLHRPDRPPVANPGQPNLASRLFRAPMARESELEYGLASALARSTEPRPAEPTSVDSGLQARSIGGKFPRVAAALEGDSSRGALLVCQKGPRLLVAARSVFAVRLVRHGLGDLPIPAAVLPQPQIGRVLSPLPTARRLDDTQWWQQRGIELEPFGDDDGWLVRSMPVLRLPALSHEQAITLDLPSLAPQIVSRLIRLDSEDRGQSLDVIAEVYGHALAPQLQSETVLVDIDSLIAEGSSRILGTVAGHQLMALE